MDEKDAQAERTRFNELLAEIGSGINVTLDFDHIMDRVLAVAERALGFATAGLLLREGDSWVIRYVRGYPQAVLGRRYSGQEMPHATLAVAAKQVFVVPDVLTDPRVPAANAADYEVRAMMVVPVVARGDAIGALFFNYADGPVNFTPAQIEFGHKLAGAISLALDNARLYDAERQGRALFKSMFDHAPMGIVLVEGPELRVVMANPSFLAFLGTRRSEREMIAACLTDILPESETSDLAANLRQVVESGEPQASTEYARQHPSRGITYWRWMAVPVPAGSGELPKAMLILSDITKEEQVRKQAEALAVQVQAYAAEVQAAYDQQQQQTEALETQSEELRNSNVVLMATRDALREAQSRLEARVQERTAELLASNAALADREASLRLAANDLETEIAERRRAEAELAEQARRLRDHADLLELTHDTILVRDLDAHILYWNRGAEDQYGYAREEVLGQRSHTLLKTKFPQPIEQVYAKLLQTGRWEGELWHTRRDGQQIVVYSRWALQRDERGQPVRVLETNNDITARQIAEQELVRHAKRLQVLHEIDLEVLAARSAQQIAQTTVEHMRQIVACELAAVIVFDFEHDQAQCLAVDAVGETAISAGTTTALSEYESLEKYERAEAYTAEDLARMEVTSPLLQALQAEGMQSYVSVPLRVQGRMTGLLNLACSVPGAFTPVDADIAREVADSLAVAMEQARLHESERQARAVAETLAVINTALTQSLDLDVVLETLLSSLQKLVPYRSAQIMLREDDSSLVVRARRAANEAAQAEYEGPALRIANVQRIPALAEPLASGEILLIPDTDAYPGWNRMPRLDEAGAWLGVPLLAGGTTLGLCSIYRAQTHRFTGEDVRLVRAVAGQASVALENARLFRQIDAGRRQLQALSRRLVDVQEEERRYIARDLHDEAGQALTSLMVGLGLIARDLGDRPELVARVQGLKQMTDGVMENLHRLSARLRPATLDRLGLVPALRQYVEAFLEENGLQGEFASVGLDDIHLPQELEITVYRVVQEALTNVARHAHASRIGVLLEKRSADGKLPRVLAIIEDDGVGFDPVAAAQRGRLGLFGMQERAQMLGGTFQVESEPEAGTTVFVEIPILPDEK